MLTLLGVTRIIKLIIEEWKCVILERRIVQKLPADIIERREIYLAKLGKLESLQFYASFLQLFRESSWVKVSREIVFT